MQIGLLSCTPTSVHNVIDDVTLDGQLVAVHGTLYLGGQCLESEFVCIQKNGPFDGIDVGRVQIEDRKRVLLVDDESLQSKLVLIGSRACGEFLYKYDVIIIGYISRQETSHYSVRICDLQMMILQDAAVESIRSPLSVLVINFANSSLPELPFTGPDLTRSIPSIRIHPL